MARKSLVAANWKLNGSHSLCEQFARDLGVFDATDVWLFPTALHLSLMVDLFKQRQNVVGAQNVAIQQSGAYTGEVAANMVAELGGKAALVGHSERRSLFGESDEIVASKFKIIQTAGLIPVLCVGESLEKRDKGMAYEAVQQQLQAVEASWDQPDLRHHVIAYEPVWAIGTGRAASSEQVQEMHMFIRDHVNQNSNNLESEIRILYGGSVNVENAAELIQQQDVDGFLVGGASLNTDSFNGICEIVNS